MRNINVTKVYTYNKTDVARCDWGPWVLYTLRDKKGTLSFASGAISPLRCTKRHGPRHSVQQLYYVNVILYFSYRHVSLMETGLAFLHAQCMKSIESNSHTLTTCTWTSRVERPFHERSPPKIRAGHLPRVCWTTEGLLQCLSGHDGCTTVNKITQQPMQT